MHQLVQAVTRYHLDLEQKHQWATTTLQLVRAAFPDRHRDPDAWPDYGRLLPHALAVTDHARAGDIDVDETTWLLNEAGLYLRQRAAYRQARTLLERALSIREARLGANHLNTSESLNNLAAVLRDQGDLNGARTLLERALSIREARLGADHPTTAQSLNNLARVLADQGDLQGARPLLERALTIYEARLGADHLLTVGSRQRLAAVVAALDNRQ
jgi:tetratricopeptide (TPR) repeat protein